MTTVAFAGGVMVVDSQTSGDSGALGTWPKLVEMKGRWFSLLGDLCHAHQFVRCLTDPEAQPRVDELNPDSGACELLPNSKLRMYSGAGYIDYEAATFTACGSGAKAAMALMHAGHDPVSTLRWVAMVDLYTRGPFHAVKYDNVEMKFVKWEAR